MWRPAGGQFTVEMAGNKGLTTLSHGGKFAKTFGDGEDHPDGLEKSNGDWSVVQQLVCRSWTDTLFTVSPRRTCMQRTNLVRTHAIFVAR